MSKARPNKKLKTGPIDNTRLMSTGVIIGLVLIGLFSFSALIALAGYSGDLREKNNGQAHVLSNSAIGFAGLRLLLDETGKTINLDPEPPRAGYNQNLRLITLNSAYQTDTLKEIEAETPVLIILPKWNVFPIAKSPGWVESSSVKPLQNAKTLASNLKSFVEEISIVQAGSGRDAEETSFLFAGKSPIYTRPIKRLQSFSLNKAKVENADKKSDGTQAEETYTGETHTSETQITKTIETPSKLIPLITIENSDRFILARVDKTQTYILSDPDFLNTQGLIKKQGARMALDILSVVQKGTATQGFTFDLSLHGLGGKQNMVKLFTRPPFLSLTLLLVTLIGFLGWQAFIRFGDPKTSSVKALGDDLQMGPQSLARTTADVLSITKKEAELMPSYAEHIRRQALSELGFTLRKPAELLEALKQREVNKNITPDFETLSKKASKVTHKNDIVSVAQALQKWKKDITI